MPSDLMLFCNVPGDLRKLFSRAKFFDKVRDERHDYKSQPDEHDVSDRPEKPGHKQHYTDQRRQTAYAARQFRNCTCFTHKWNNIKRP